MIKRLKLSFPLLILLCLFSVLLLVCCGGGNKLTDAYITNSNLPRTTYVEGQELDLSRRSSAAARRLICPLPQRVSPCQDMI